MCQGSALADPPEQSGRPAKSGHAPSRRATPLIFEGTEKREEDGRIPAPKQTTGASIALAFCALALSAVVPGNRAERGRPGTHLPQQSRGEMGPGSRPSAAAGTTTERAGYIIERHARCD